MDSLQGPSEGDNSICKGDFATSLMMCRLELKLTQQEVADILGIHQSQISRCERGCLSTRSKALNSIWDWIEQSVARLGTATTQQTKLI